MANRFAAALLVPANVAKWELGEKRRHLTFAELGVLKEKYGLESAGVGAACQMEIISEGLYKSMCIEFSGKGWRKHEPYGYSGHEKPKRLVQMALRAVTRRDRHPGRGESYLRESRSGPDGCG